MQYRDHYRNKWRIFLNIEEFDTEEDHDFLLVVRRMHIDPVYEPMYLHNKQNYTSKLFLILVLRPHFSSVLVISRTSNTNKDVYCPLKKRFTCSTAFLRSKYISLFLFYITGTKQYAVYSRRRILVILLLSSYHYIYTTLHLHVLTALVQSGNTNKIITYFL